MTKLTLASTLLAAAFLIAGQVAPAGAAAPTKVWVAKAGTDNNTCGAVTAPCRTFQQAHDNVAAGGEIGVLTPGDYGPVVISKSVSITNDGPGEAGILAPNTFGVMINAGSGVVSLRGLVIDGLGSGQNGIRLFRASALHVQKCVIRNFQGSGPEQYAGQGITIVPADATQVFISDTLVSNNGYGSDTFSGGIFIIGQNSGSVHAVLERVRLENNVKGLDVRVPSSFAASGLHVFVRNSVVSGNASDGVVAAAGPGPGVFIFLKNSSVANNGGFGVAASNVGSTVVMSKVAVARNGTGVASPGLGRIISYSNNEIDNNLGSDGDPTSLNAPH